jgi:hypothetical protein
MYIQRKQSTPHHTLMPANLHFFAHAKQLLSPLSQTHSKHTTCLPLHCTALYPYQTLAATSHPPTINTCSPALSPSQPHPTQPAASWLAPSPTTYSSCVNDGTCRRAPAIAAPPSRPMLFPPRLSCTHPRQQPVLTHHQTHHTTCTYNAHNLHLTTHCHTLMPANLHFFAHAEQLLTPLPHTQSKHTTCLALHCIVPLPNTRSHFHMRPPINTCGPPLPPSHPHPTQPAASWLAPSPTTYSSHFSNGTCRRAPAIAATPSGPMPFPPRLPCAHTHAQHPLLIHHQTHNTTCTYNVHNLHLTTHSCLQTYTSLLMPNTSLAPCHTRIQNTPRASHCTALYPPKTTRSHFHMRPPINTCGPP